MESLKRQLIPQTEGNTICRSPSPLRIYMSRFFGCVNCQKQTTKPQPAVCAGYQYKWKPIGEMSDEFNGNSLNGHKWLPYSPFSFGTQPGLFVPSNVTVRNGCAHLRAQCNGVPADAPPGYGPWTTSALVSRHETTYGYFEARFYVSNSPLLSRFVLIGDWHGEKQSSESEITILSYAVSERTKDVVSMNARASRSSSEDEAGDVWRSEEITRPLEKRVMENMAEVGVVVGLDWTPEVLTTYVDGRVIRTMDNFHWHSAMRIGFLLETVVEEFGVPAVVGRRLDLDVDYVRCWYRYRCHQKVVTTGMHVDMDGARGWIAWMSAQASVRQCLQAVAPNAVHRVEAMDGVKDDLVKCSMSLDIGSDRIGWIAVVTAENKCTKSDHDFISTIIEKCTRVGHY